MTNKEKVWVVTEVFAGVAVINMVTRTKVEALARHVVCVKENADNSDYDCTVTEIEIN